ncbi:MAG: TldD/PmbA family protein [Elusimicrobia bacterium]|nr:TldD/PmbA family protein [Elusimicrobiota bacterium]
MERLDIRPADYPCVSRAADYGEIYLEESQSLAIRLEDSRIDDVAVVSERGMAMRFLRRRPASVETLHGSANAVDPATAVRLGRELMGAKAFSGRPAPPPDLCSSVHRHPMRIDPTQVPIAEKIGMLRSMDKLVRGEFPHIRQVSISYAERARVFAVINSENSFRREERTGLLLAVTVVAEKDGLLQAGSTSVGAIRGFELLEGPVPADLCRTAAQRAVDKLDAPKAKAGEMPVVIASCAGGTLIHEAIGHSLEADHIQEGTSPAYKGKLGATVAPETVTIIDDPTMPFFRGSFAYDDEGIETRPTALVKNGVLRDYLYDRSTAMRERRPSNGHGRRESFYSRPIPRMSNLYIAPGPDDPAEILRSLKSGIYVTRMGGGQVNTTTGEFVFEVDEGYWVKDGAVKHLVRDANLLGVGPEVLKSIDRLGSDLGWGIGTCGKDGQSVPVTDGQPTLRIPRLLIGGRHDGGVPGVQQP